MVLQNYQNVIKMTSNTIHIVAFSGGLKRPRKIHLNTQCSPPPFPKFSDHPTVLELPAATVVHPPLLFIEFSQRDHTQQIRGMRRDFLIRSSGDPKKPLIRQEIISRTHNIKNVYQICNANVIGSRLKINDWSLIINSVENFPRNESFGLKDLA